MKKLMMVSCCAAMLLTACGQLSTPNLITGPENASSAFTETTENVSSTFTETTVNSFNPPFITIDETLGLYNGMNTNSVISLCGKPLYVAMGDSEQIVWVYLVRELLVGNARGERELVKTSDITEYASSMHYIALSFEFGELAAWAQISAGNVFNDLIFGTPTEDSQ